MPDLASAVCVFLVVVLVGAAATGYVWSHRHKDQMGSLMGLGALLVAGLPAAAYAAMSAF